jgi:hypothetical protein
VSAEFFDGQQHVFEETVMLLERRLPLLLVGALHYPKTTA